MAEGRQTDETMPNAAGGVTVHFCASHWWFFLDMLHLAFLECSVVASLMVYKGF